MARTYREICDSIDYPLENYIHLLPVQKKLWFAYNDGKAIECKTVEAAKKFKLYETVYDPVSLKEIQDFWAERTEKEKLAVQIFSNELRAEYSNVSDELYTACYEAAKSKIRKTSDHEEIPERLKFFIEFSLKAIAIEKEHPSKIEETDQTTDEVSAAIEPPAELVETREPAQESA